ncbi:MAG: NAD(P)H-dependent oxidoreductase [Lachnospiraceae bacterium]|nr:NAD(P)H-dependent oxidoreductase [Lachnospiraceae bacterium]
MRGYGMILLINACVRQESRTKRLADHYLQRFNEPVTEVDLQKISFPLADEDFLSRRDRLCEEWRLDDPMFFLARQFASADHIVIAAPYWNLSFPAALQQYFEQICVRGITFMYNAEGNPQGLCRAQELIYITTAGRDPVPWDYGYGYVKALAESYFGIREVRLIQAAGLDMIGADTEAILAESIWQASSEERQRTKREQQKKTLTPVLVVIVFVIYLIGCVAVLMLAGWSPALLMMVIPLVGMIAGINYVLKERRKD